MKHTPGPWTTSLTMEFQVTEDGEDALPFEAICVDAGTGESIALVTKDQVSHGQAEANARLIAAAPDLLTSLQRLDEVFFEEKNGKAGLANEIREQINSAIAKATSLPINTP